MIDRLHLERIVDLDFEAHFTLVKQITVYDIGYLIARRCSTLDPSVWSKVDSDAVGIQLQNI